MKPLIITLTAVLLTACGSDSGSPTNSSSTPTNTGTTESGTSGTAEDDLLNNDGDASTTTDGTDTSTEVDNSGTPTDPATGSNTDTGNTGDGSEGNTDTSTDTTGNTGTVGDQTDTDTAGTENTDTGETGNTDTGTEEPDPAVTVGDCTVPAAGTTLVSATTPVASIGNPYYPDMGPQCVVPGSQFDGPGLQYGDFLLTNNAWNGQQSTWDWQQCISVTAAADGSILPSWTFDWGNEDDLQPGLFEWEVKSYPEIIYGAKSNTEVSAPCASTGLPVLMQDVPEISIAYNYRTTLTNSRVGDQGDEANNPVAVTGGDRNIALETFFHSSCDVQRGSTSNMELELMVWLEVGNERLPSGSAPAHTFTNSAGQIYDVYTKPGNDKYVAYVAQNVVQADTLEWNDFINDARTNAGTYNIRAIQDSWCLANVIFGSEIWWGEGSVNLDYYQITSRF